MKALAVVSGGIDSVTALYETDIAVTHVLFFNYGQKSLATEYQWAAYHASYLGKTFQVLDIESTIFSNSGLLEGNEGSYDVVCRNAHLLTIAAMYAHFHKLDTVITGLYQTDDYPDATEEFFNAMDKVIQLSSSSQVSIYHPFKNLSKPAIILRALELGVDLSKTVTCYEADEGEGVHCGKCPACENRKKCFDMVEVEDPTIYRS